MLLKRLQLHDFRNYARADFAPCPGILVLHGNNAQGKTALLEAVYLCATGRSHRTSYDRELIRWDQPFARVQVETEKIDGSHQIEIVLPQDGRKVVNVSGSPIGRSGELMGHVMAVLFSPEDLRMVKDGPVERRRFIDMELSQIRPAYYYQLQRYHRALTQRGKLLRDALRDERLLSTLPTWDEQLALSGAQIIEARRAFVEQLSGYAADIHGRMTSGGERLTARYQCSIESDETGAALSEALLRALTLARATDVRRGMTTVGPHRDDLLLLLDGVDARTYGSQGQQRSTALSLKLSELEVMRAETGEYPILMLDDVMSELDPMRRRQLLDALSAVQVLITCTDASDLAGAAVEQAVRIEGGRIV